MVLIKNPGQKSLLILIFLLLVCLPSQLNAVVPKAQSLLQNMLTASKSLDYEGRLTLMAQDQTRNMVFELMVTRKAPDKRRVEIISPSEMAGSGFIINGNDFSPLFPPNREPNNNNRGPRDRGMFMPLFQPEQMDEGQGYNIQQLLKNYKVRVLEGGFVAGRNTYLLEIDPRNSDRASRKIWVDKEKSIPLKTEQYNIQKVLQKLIAFSKISFGMDISDDVFRIQRKLFDFGKQRKPPEHEELWNQSQGGLDLDKIKEKAKFDATIPNILPGGLMLQSINMIKFDKNQNIHLRYTDGITFISIFQSPFDEARRERERHEGPPQGGGPQGNPPGPPREPPKIEKMKILNIECDVMQMGSNFIFRWYKGGVYFTLIGDYKKIEMIKMVGSIIKKEATK
jgi:outer membrane lipoprotein-sorting protein